MKCQTLVPRSRLLVRLTLAIAVLASVGVPVRAQAQTATLTFPSNGAVGADLTQPLQWTSVAGVQAYYLYVGTTVGAKNVVDSGETLQTSYLASNVPLNQTLYARLWTRAGGVWRYVDSTFSAASTATLASTLTFPVNGAVNADLTQPIRWMSVPNVQAYDSYVGTGVGLKDLIDSGETLATSYSAINLPSGQTLYARIWTKIAGDWRFVDSTFTVAAPVIARLTFPLNGASNADLTQPIQWTPIANVQAYYLYVGTTAGAKDLVDTGEILATSYLAHNLPSGQTLYARIWTRVGNVWRYADSTFTAAPVLTAKMTYPVDGATNVDVTRPFQWTAVQNVQAYYLYVGLTPGAQDVVSSGEISQTSYSTFNNIPAGQTLYVQIWTKVGGVWRSVNSTFTAAPVLTARITFPLNGATNVDLTQPIHWTTVGSAQAYYLYLGTSLGAKDLIDSNETLQTSWYAGIVPTGQTLYARIWTKVGGIWRYTDSTFVASITAPLRATLTYPADGATDVAQPVIAAWTSVANVQAYYLYLGTTPGAKDLIDSQETLFTTWPMPALPSGQTLYARLWTKVAGVWRYRDSTFTASPSKPHFIYPRDGELGANPATPVIWWSPLNADLQHLRIGTTPGANDVYDSGDITATSMPLTGLPASGPLYARASSRVQGVWRHTDIAFTFEASVTPAAIVVPANGAAAFDSAKLFEWSEVALARGYRLTIGTTPGGTNLHDSGEIHVARRLIPGLPLGPLYGRLYTKIAGDWLPAHVQWLSTDFTFTVASNASSSSLQINAALWATDLVRRMALTDNVPFSWTALASTIGARDVAACTDYALTLLNVLGQMNLQLSSRKLEIAFNTNGFDTHTLVEMLDPGSNRWLMLDPTFDLTVKTVNGAWATAEDISAATQALQWSSVSYLFLGAQNNAYARAYYLDYPLLYLNVFHVGQTWTLGQGHSVLPYLLTVPLPASTTYQFFGASCAPGTNAELLVDGVTRTFACTGVNGLSQLFGASTITSTAQTDPSVVVYAVRRYLF